MKLNEVTIPDELKKFALKKRITRIILFTILIAIAVFVLVNWGEIIFKVKKEDIGFRYLFYALVLAIPFAITKIWLVFTDTSYIGVVKEVKIKSIVTTKNTIRPMQSDYYRNNETYLIIQTAKGVIKRKVFDSTSYNEPFKAEDTVLHIHGTGITIVLPTKADTSCQCAICGRPNEISLDHCERCGMPIVKM